MLCNEHTPIAVILMGFQVEEVEEVEVGDVVEEVEENERSLKIMMLLK